MLIIVPTFEMVKLFPGKDVIVAPIHPRRSLRQFCLESGKYFIEEKKKKSLTLVFNKIKRHNNEVLFCFPPKDMTLKLDCDNMSTTPLVQVWHLRELYDEFIAQNENDNFENDDDDDDDDDATKKKTKKQMFIHSFDHSFDSLENQTNLANEKAMFETECKLIQSFSPILSTFVSFHQPKKQKDYDTYLFPFAHNKNLFKCLQHFYLYSINDGDHHHPLQDYYFIFKIKACVGKGWTFLEIFDLLLSLYEKGCVVFEGDKISFPTSSSSSSSSSSLNLSKKEATLLSFLISLEVEVGDNEYVSVNKHDENDDHHIFQNLRNQNLSIQNLSIAEVATMMICLENIGAIRAIGTIGAIKQQQHQHQIEITDWGKTFFLFLVDHFGDYYLNDKSLDECLEVFRHKERTSCFRIDSNHRFLGGNVWGRKSCIEFADAKSLSFLTVKPEYQNLTFEIYEREQLSVEKMIIKTDAKDETKKYFSKSMGFQNGYEIILRRSQFGPFVSFAQRTGNLPRKKNVSVGHFVGSRPIESITSTEVLTSWDI